MEPTGVDVDELIEFWTLLDEDPALLAGRQRRYGAGVRGAVLKHYSPPRPDHRLGVDPSGLSGPPRPRPLTAMLLGLTVATGVIDAVSIVGLGKGCVRVRLLRATFGSAVTGPITGLALTFGTDELP